MKFISKGHLIRRPLETRRCHIIPPSPSQPAVALPSTPLRKFPLTWLPQCAPLEISKPVTPLRSLVSPLIRVPLP